MANRILTSSGFADGPDFEEEENPMAEQAAFPKYYYSKDEPQNRVQDSGTGQDLCGSRLFNSQEDLDAAGGNAVWKATPQEASQAQQQPQAGQPGQRVIPGTQPPPPVRPSPPHADPEDEDEEPHQPTVPRRR